MATRIPQLRVAYKSVARRVQHDEFDNLLYSDVKKYRAIAQEEQQRVVSSADYGNLQQAQFYMQKFSNMEHLMRSRKNKQISSQELKTKSKVIFVSQNFVPVNPSTNQNPNVNIQAPNTVTYLSNVDNLRYQPTNNRQSMENLSGQRSISPQRQALNDFFSSKGRQNQSNIGFQSVLQNPSTVSRNFRKKINENQNQLNNLRRQNTQLRNRLNNGNVMNSQQQRRLQESYRRYELRIKDLEAENSRLSRDNTVLRSQRAVTVVTANTYDDDYLYSPYTFTTKNNDIYKINVRNMSQYQDKTERDISQYEPEPKAQVIYKKIGYQYENYSQRDHHNERAQANYSVFDMNRSTYSENGQVMEGDFQQKIYLRNKVAFFKPKGILVRNRDLQIGYKRSQPQSNSQLVRVILYFNNKNSNYKIIRTNYEYEQDYYEVTVTERIRDLQGFTQGREVVEVRLRGSKDDLNSMIDVNINVGREVYKIWLPAMFLRMGGGSNGNYSTSNATKTIYPIKSFSRPNQAAKFIEGLQNSGSDQAQFWVNSAKGSGPVKMMWNQEKGKLKVETNPKWLDFITFLMAETS